MQKLKKKIKKNLINYEFFLKNNYLKKNKNKLKKILFENQFLFKNIDFNIVEFNNIENIYIPYTVLNYNDISTIQIQYQNQFLFNYILNYDILYQFNSIMLKNIIKKKENIIKGRITGGTKKKVYISILGIIFSIKPVYLNNLLNKKKRFYFNKSRFKNNFKKKFKNKNFIYTAKHIRIVKLINNYKIKHLNFKINSIIIKKKEKKIISRITYLQEIIKNNQLKKKAFFREKKMYMKKKKK